MSIGFWQIALVVVCFVVAVDSASLFGHSPRHLCLDIRRVQGVYGDMFYNSRMAPGWNTRVHP